jgi:RNA polymerase sigma-70 factor (ECF subfamily)
MDTVSRPTRRPEGESRDADLLRLLRAGQPSAVDQLYQRFAGPAFALARRLLADDAGAERAVRAAFVDLWRDPGIVSAARSSVVAVLLALVHQHAVEAIRDGSAHRPASREPGGAGSRPSPAHRMQVTDSERDAIAERVRLALALLPATQRQALTLAYYGGYTQREVAALTGVPLSTVRIRMLAGMRRLQEEVDDGGEWAAGGARGAAAADGPGR